MKNRTSKVEKNLSPEYRKSKKLEQLATKMLNTDSRNLELKKKTINIDKFYETTGSRKH